MMDEQQRAKFEAWASDRNMGVDRSSSGGYRFIGSFYGWLAWKASAAESAAEIERLRAALTSLLESDTYRSEYDGRMYTHCMGCDAMLSDGQPHSSDCSVLAARAALSEKQP